MWILQTAFGEEQQLATISCLLSHLSDLSQSCHTRAQYFLRKHGKGLALFYAIARTKIFTEELFRVRVPIVGRELYPSSSADRLTYTCRRS